MYCVVCHAGRDVALPSAFALIAPAKQRAGAHPRKKREPTSLVNIIYSSLMYYVGQSKGACNSQGRSPSRSKVAYFLLTVRLSSLSSAGRARFSVLIRIAIVCITTGNRVRIFVCVCVFQATTMHFIGIYYIVKYTNI